MGLKNEILGNFIRVKTWDASVATIRSAVRKGQPHVKGLHDQPVTIDLITAYGGIAGELLMLLAATLMIMLRMLKKNKYV